MEVLTEKKTDGVIETNTYVETKNRTPGIEFLPY